MIENYEHYITKNIRAYYKRRIWMPLIYIVILGICWFVFSMSSILKPINLSADADLEYFYQKESHYVNATFHDLHFTGYIATARGDTQGYYYYVPWGDSVAIVLLSPKTCEQGIPNIEKLHVNGKLQEGAESYQKLLNKLAEDLKWTESGIENEVPAVYFSEPANQYRLTYILFAFYFATLLFAVLSLIMYLIHIIFPVTAPACSNLVVFGNPRKLLEEAEEELATLPQLATEDMFITEHYFIMTSPVGNAIVPISQILWIYKHSTLHKFLWYHFSISYTMHIYANKHFYFHCPKNIKSDIDGIMDYLAEANHEIVVGFSEKNRLAVQAKYEKPFHVEKIVAFLRKRI